MAPLTSGTGANGGASAKKVVPQRGCAHTEGFGRRSSAPASAKSGALSVPAATTECTGIIRTASASDMNGARHAGLAIGSAASAGITASVPALRRNTSTALRACSGMLNLKSASFPERAASMLNVTRVRRASGTQESAAAVINATIATV